MKDCIERWYDLLDLIGADRRPVPDLALSTARRARLKPVPGQNPPGPGPDAARK